jgi:hypothetical protein
VRDSSPARTRPSLEAAGSEASSVSLDGAPIELANDIGANAPERLLVGLRFLAPFSWGTQKRKTAAPKASECSFGRVCLQANL